MGICAVSMDEANHAHRESLLQLRDEAIERRAGELIEPLLENELTEVTERVLGESDQLPEILESLFNAKDAEEAFKTVKHLKDEYQEWAAAIAEVRASKEFEE